MPILPTERIRPAVWQKTTLRRSIVHFGTALDNIHSLFPHRSEIQQAREDYHNLQHHGKDRLQTVSGGKLLVTPSLRRIATDIVEFTENSGIVRDKSWVSTLDAGQWRLAMDIFQHRDPIISPQERQLLDDYMPVVFRAAFIGLLRVLCYGRDLQINGEGEYAGKLLALPELQGVRYVYVRSCQTGL